MIDIVNCSHCGIPVTWGRYADHIQVEHGNWGSILPPRVVELDAVLDCQQQAMDLQEENDDLKDESANLEEEVHKLEEKLSHYTD